MKARKVAKASEGYLEVTEAEYQASLAKGLDEESLLKPGRYKFIRGGFKKMHPDYDPKTTKVKISMYLDKDVLSHFRARAERPNAAPYQTQINNALREVMERDQAVAPGTPSPKAAALVKDAKFIAAVAKQVEASLKRKSKSKPRVRAA